MSELNVKATRPVESPADPDPVSRLLAVLTREGFSPVHEEGEWQALGEEVYHRAEDVLFARGETVVILINFPDLTERVIAQAVEGIANLFRARSSKQKALSVFQTTTVYVCIIARSGIPHYRSLAQYISTGGGAVIIPIILAPDLNQAVYPSIEKKVSGVRPRLEYFQYLLGERSTYVPIHRQTIQAFWISVGFVAVLGIFAILSAFA